MYKLWYNSVDCSTDRAGCWSCAGLCTGGQSAGTGKRLRHGRVCYQSLTGLYWPSYVTWVHGAPWHSICTKQHNHVTSYKLVTQKEIYHTSSTLKMTNSFHYMTCTCIDLLYKGAHTIEISFSCTCSTSYHFRSCPVYQAERHRNRRRAVGACSLTVVGKHNKWLKIQIT